MHVSDDFEDLGYDEDFVAPINILRTRLILITIWSPVTDLDRPTDFLYRTPRARYLREFVLNTGISKPRSDLESKIRRYL